MSLVALHHCVTASADDTRALGSRLGPVLDIGDLIVLTGDLGAGKTQFVKGLAAALGITDPVTSPTFALHQQYEGRLRLHHLDVYRLDAISETLDLDLPELLDTGVTVVEWGEAIAPVLPPQSLTVRLVLDAHDDNRRIVTFEAEESAAARWRRRIAAVMPEVSC